jgi:hypothetical protein
VAARILLVFCPGLSRACAVASRYNYNGTLESLRKISLAPIH